MAACLFGTTAAVSIVGCPSMVVHTNRHAYTWLLAVHAIGTRHHCRVACQRKMGRTGRCSPSFGRGVLRRRVPAGCGLLFTSMCTGCGILNRCKQESRGIRGLLSVSCEGGRVTSPWRYALLVFLRVTLWSLKVTDAGVWLVCRHMHIMTVDGFVADYIHHCRCSCGLQSC